MNAPEKLKGIVHGKSIELEHAIAIPDGSEIEVTIRQPTSIESTRDERLRSLFGSCEGDAADFDQYLEQNRQHRLLDRPVADK